MSLNKFILISIFISTKLFSWDKLYSLDSNKYSFKDFGFDNINCLELRAYPINPSTRKQITNRWTVPISICKDIQDNVLSRFQNIKPDLSYKCNIRKNQILPVVLNAMTIDNDGKIWSMNEIKDVLGFIGDIDTPAKLQLVLWLYGENEGCLYQKRFNNYEVMVKYKTSSKSHNKSYLNTFVYKLTISKYGKLLNKKLFKHTKVHTPYFDKPTRNFYTRR
ncbi:hypothetical protein MNB_SV-9-904 [hydrothermal vent metagenome]|uniref:Uncharacterized protein n=1 Tax=hydrothermal vent metagenome TaxID=652676 RepID=A0A1W1C9S7_9ZZZZ